MSRTCQARGWRDALALQYTLSHRIVCASVRQIVWVASLRALPCASIRAAWQRIGIPERCSTEVRLVLSIVAISACQIKSVAVRSTLGCRYIRDRDAVVVGGGSYGCWDAEGEWGGQADGVLKVACGLLVAMFRSPLQKPTVQVGPLTPASAAARYTLYWSAFPFWKVTWKSLFAATVSGARMPSRAWTHATKEAASTAPRLLGYRIFLSIPPSRLFQSKIVP